MFTHRNLLIPSKAPGQQRGAATLIVVMLLFFVISMTAAYTGRNLIFEQRTSANQYRSTQSIEAAEAGLEWAISLLNAGRIDDSCLPTTDTSLGSLRQRYLTFYDPDAPNPAIGLDAPGKLVPKLRSDLVSTPVFGCVFNGTDWVCSCPSDLNADPPLAAPTGAGQFPAFGVRFWRLGGSPGAVRIEVSGCTQWDLACINYVATGGGVDASNCRKHVCALVALHSGMKVPPAAPVTSRGGVSGSSLAVYNPDSASGGTTIHSGSIVSVTSLIVGSAPGSPASKSTIENDTALAALPADTTECRHCVFSSVFNLSPASYKDQPAVVDVDCTGSCDAAGIATKAAENPGRILWLRGGGGLSLSTAATIGSQTQPALLVVEGPVTATGGATVFGLIYGQSPDLSSGTFNGAIVAGNSLTGSGSAEIVYDPKVMYWLRYATGSFVRVPGSWRDFP